MGRGCLDLVAVIGILGCEGWLFILSSLSSRRPSDDKATRLTDKSRAKIPQELRRLPRRSMSCAAYYSRVFFSCGSKWCVVWLKGAMQKHTWSRIGNLVVMRCSAKCNNSRPVEAYEIFAESVFKVTNMQYSNMLLNTSVHSHLFCFLTKFLQQPTAYSFF